MAKEYFLLLSLYYLINVFICKSKLVHKGEIFCISQSSIIYATVKNKESALHLSISKYRVPRAHSVEQIFLFNFMLPNSLVTLPLR